MFSMNNCDEQCCNGGTGGEDQTQASLFGGDWEVCDMLHIFTRTDPICYNRHAGRSRVKREGIPWMILIRHFIKRDFFNSAVNAKLLFILMALCIFYSGLILWWTCMYYFIWTLHPGCFIGFNGLVSALLFSIETQNTIGKALKSLPPFLSNTHHFSLHHFCFCLTV
jgi:hypothetical protein